MRGDGSIVVRNKTRWRDGTTHVVMTPDQFMQRLVALVPAPRANLTRYHGVFAANHRLRAKIVPGPGPKQLVLSGADGVDGMGWEQAPGKAVGGGRTDRYDWSSLLRRVFEVDVTVCPDCGGPMSMIASITQPSVVGRILRHLGLPTHSPADGLARGPPNSQLSLEISGFAAA